MEGIPKKGKWLVKLNQSCNFMMCPIEEVTTFSDNFTN